MPQRPNILVVTTHDSGRHFGCYGVREVDTPTIDAIAADGVKLDRCYTAVPICCASRASMLTGRYPQSHGLLDLCFAPFDWALRSDERHLSHILRDAGYHTRLFGMQHEAKSLATLAFDAADGGGPDGRLGNAHEVIDSLGRFLRNPDARSRPFYAQVGFFESHTPFGFGGATPDTRRGIFVPPYLHRDESSERACAALQGAIRQIDLAMAALLDHLRAAGLEQNTLLVFTTDHGVELPRSKWFCYDPGIEIAMLLRWPGGGLRGGRVIDSLVSNVDFVPTLLRLTGLPDEPRTQGVSFADLARGVEAPERREIFAMYHKSAARAVRTRRHKFIRSFDAATDFSRVPVRLDEVLAKRPIGLVELYDLDADPREFHNLAGKPEHAAIQADLDARLWRWMESVSDPLLSGPVPTPSYKNALRDYASWRSGPNNP